MVLSRGERDEKVRCLLNRPSLYTYIRRTMWGKPIKLLVLMTAGVLLIRTK